MFDRAVFGRRVLLAGCGGGFDVLGAVPLWHALRGDPRFTSHRSALVPGSAIQGEFGATAPHVWLSPLLNMFWFFDAHTVAATHKFLDLLAPTDSIWEVAARIEGARKSLAIRERAQIPV